MTEDQLEQETLAWLANVGWQHRQGPDLAPDGPAPERDNHRQVVLTGRLRQAVARESGRLEGGLTVLATVGSTGPFVGLLGTVWGIYHALIRISASGDASMSAVAGPVGEALIMTAFGLFVAIPAVLAYNFFVRSNRVILARFDEFAHDLHDFFATGSRVEAGAPAPARHAAPAAPAARK